MNEEKNPIQNNNEENVNTENTVSETGAEVPAEEIIPADEVISTEAEITEEITGEMADEVPEESAGAGISVEEGEEIAEDTDIVPAETEATPADGGKKKKGRNKILDVLLVFCIAGLMVSGYFLMSDIIPRFQNAKNIKQIQEVSPIIDTTTDPDKLPSIEYLKEINKDIVGWINIPNTNIDYPLLQCSNNDYYLQYSYNEKWNDAGSIYLDYRNEDDFSDQNTVIYGHARYDGSMFAQVLYYKKQSQYEKAPFITIVLEGKVYYYQIFSANIVEATEDYRKANYGSDFTNFIRRMRNSSMIKSSAKVDKNSKIITLSTCTNVIEDGRLALLAVLLNPDGEKINLADYPI